MPKIINIVAIALILASSAFAADAPPKKKKKMKWLQDLATQADSPSHRPATVAGVRGLEEVGAAPDLAARDFAAIDRLDDVQIQPEELKKFIEAGKLR